MEMQRTPREQKTVLFLQTGTPSASFSQTMRHLFRLALAFLFLSAGHAEAIIIQFDYTYDTSNFFGAADSPQRADLSAAAQVFSTTFTDSLTQIVATGRNTWNATFDDPTTGGAVSLNKLSIAPDTILVYVGASDSLGANVLGEGGPGGYSGLSGSQSWVDTVEARGQTGALASTPTNFGPWGGAVSFSSTTSWYFDPDVTTSGDLPRDENDFYSVAVHELAHLLGLGTAPSWDADISGSSFAGSHSTLVSGGLHPTLSADKAHWADGTMSTIFNTRTIQETDMDPAITVGTRKYFTSLDYAGLQDVGWTMVPEPSSCALLLLGVGAVYSRRRFLR
jgi:hypothetical protein